MLLFVTYVFVALSCPSLSNPANGNVALSSGLALGSTATYTCINGYRTSFSSLRYCQADGQWSGEQPTCIRKCLSPASSWSILSMPFKLAVCLKHPPPPGGTPINKGRGILVPLRGSFQYLRRAPVSFLFWIAPPPTPQLPIDHDGFTTFCVRLARNRRWRFLPQSGNIVNV